MKLMSPPDLIAEYIYLPLMPKPIRDLYNTLKYNGETWEYDGFHLLSSSGWSIWSGCSDAFALSIMPPQNSLCTSTITKFKSKGCLLSFIFDPGAWVIWRAVKSILRKTPMNPKAKTHRDNYWSGRDSYSKKVYYL